MVSENRKLYLEREKRVDDAISLKIPDRVPIVTATEFFFTRTAGLSDAEAMYDYDRMAEAWKISMKRYNWDMAPLQHAMRSGILMELMDIKTFKWPGFNLPDNSYYQWVEKEYMLADEYDEFLKDPSDFTIRKLMPRMAGALEPLSALPPITSMSTGYTILGVLSSIVSSPAFTELMEKLKEIGEEKAKWDKVQQRLREDLEAMGYPLFTYGVAQCAFDWISDCFRGMTGSMLDMYRQPDKLKAAIEFLEPITIQSALASAAQSGIKRVWIPLHRGASGFMSDEQFSEFYWPSLKKLLLSIIEAGLTPVPFFEGDYASRLEYLAELPPGKILGHFDRVDRKKCKKILGDVMCFWGNVPASLLITGTVKQVKDDVRELIDIFGDNGGLIIDASTTGPPPESKLENVAAMSQAVFEN
ncbi:uroporphyrinogen decarboxylase family protein [Thermodesulfobacteriota bacterium]